MSKKEPTFDEEFNRLFPPLTPEQKVEIKKKRYLERVKKWNKSYCNTCSLSTKKAMLSYTHHGTFRCDDPLGKVHVISNSILRTKVSECSIANELYKIKELLEHIKKNPEIRNIAMSITKHKRKKRKTTNE